MSSMRWLRWVVPGVAAAWLAVSFGQQDTPPAPPPPTEPAEPPSAPPQTPAEDEESDDDVFVPTEELAPDAAVTFPVDI